MNKQSSNHLSQNVSIFYSQQKKPRIRFIYGAYLDACAAVFFP
jgi:hypothetical protein